MGYRRMKISPNPSGDENNEDPTGRRTLISEHIRPSRRKK
jgi:hypothetical protein